MVFQLSDQVLRCSTCAANYNVQTILINNTILFCLNSRSPISLPLSYVIYTIMKLQYSRAVNSRIIINLNFTDLPRILSIKI